MESAEAQTIFFRAVCNFRPIGINKNFIIIPMTRYIRVHSGIDVTCSQVEDFIDRFYDTSKAFEQDMELPTIFTQSSPRPSSHPTSLTTSTNINDSPIDHHRRRGASNSPRKQSGTAVRSSWKRGGRFQPSPSPAPRDQRSNSIASNKKGTDNDYVYSDHGLGGGGGHGNGNGKARNQDGFIEFCLPPDEFEDLIERARKSNVESIGVVEDDGEEQDEMQVDDAYPASKKGSRKRSPSRQKSSSAVSSPSHSNSRRSKR